MLRKAGNRGAAQKAGPTEHWVLPTPDRDPASSCVCEAAERALERNVPARPSPGGLCPIMIIQPSITLMSLAAWAYIRAK